MPVVPAYSLQVTKQYLTDNHYETLNAGRRFSDYLLKIQ